MKPPVKKKLLWINICLVLAVLLLCPAVVNKGSGDGLLLWFTVVLPALFPFMVFSGVMMKIGATQTIGHYLYPVFHRLLGLSENGCYAMAVGFLSGYPLGGKTAADLLRQNAVTPEEAYAAFLARMERYEQLEVLDQNWEEEKKRLRAAFHEDNYLECIRNFHAAQQGREYEYEHLLVYFTFRYFMRSYYDDNILNKAQFAVAGILMIRDMDALRFLENGGTFSVEDRVDVAKLYSKEVEHSEENMEFLEEDFQFEDIFAPEQMIRQLFFAS